MASLQVEHRGLHKIISKLQAQYGLHNPNVLKSQTALQYEVILTFLSFLFS